jgi:hypothetical protein
MTFSLTGKTSFPRPQSDGFPQGIQWQADGVSLGDRHVQTVDLRNFGSGGVTRDQDTLTVVAGAGGGAAPGALTAFSASLTNPQTSGTTVLFDNVATLGGISYPGYNAGTGVLTIQAGDGGIWNFFVTLEAEGAAEAPGGASRFASINISGFAYATTNFESYSAFDNKQLNAVTGPIRVADGAQISVGMNAALSATNVFLVGGRKTRFSAVRLAD